MGMIQKSRYHNTERGKYMRTESVTEFLNVLQEFENIIKSNGGKLINVDTNEEKCACKPKPVKKVPDKEVPVDTDKFSHYEVVVETQSSTKCIPAFEYDVDDDYIVIIPVWGQIVNKRELDEVIYPRESVVSMTVFKVYE
jgi:hypothetical protein